MARPAKPILGIHYVWGDKPVPQFQTEESACFDLRYDIGPNENLVKIYEPTNKELLRPVGPSKEIIIMPGERALVPTGIILDIPKGYSVRIHPRSGLSLKQGLSMINCEGIIDSDYVEPLFLTMTNFSEVKCLISLYDRLAQAELVKRLDYDFRKLPKKPEQKTDRNGGFGSTGTN